MMMMFDFTKLKIDDIVWVAETEYVMNNDTIIPAKEPHNMILKGVIHDMSIIPEIYGLLISPAEYQHGKKTLIFLKNDYGYKYVHYVVNGEEPHEAIIGYYNTKKDAQKALEEWSNED